LRLVKNLFFRTANAVPAQTRTFFLCLFLTLAVFQLFRLIFLAAHWDFYRNDGLADLLVAFLIGFRFDLHTGLAVIGLPFLLLHLPGDWKRNIFVNRVLVWMPVPALLLAFSLLLIDVHYYSEAGRHLAQEVFMATDNAGDLASSLIMISQYRWSILFFFILAPLFLAVWKKAGRFSRFQLSFPGLINEIVFFVLFLVVFVIGVRGTLEPKPLKTGHAFSQGKLELGHLALNGIFTVERTLISGKGEVVNYFIPSEAAKIVLSLLNIEDVNRGNSRFPVYRKHIPAVDSPLDSTKRKPNVVLIILESWGAKYIGAMGSPVKATPVFDRLAGEGLLFTNFYATGRRSQEAMTSLLMGVPLYSGLDIFTSGLEQNSFRGIGRIFADNGYSTVFMHGGKVGTLGLNGFAGVAGFGKYIGMEDLDLAPGEYDGAWGVYDHAMLGHVNEELRRQQDPFFLLWFSLSSHEPFRIPEGSEQIMANESREGKMYNALHYTDSSLGEFFRQAEKEDYFKNTVFVLVADHSAGRHLVSIRERHLVPLLIYAPGRLQPGVVDLVGSQLDLVPTLMDVAGISGWHHALGNSLLGPGPKYAFANLGNVFGWFTGDRVLTVNTDGTAPKLYNYRTGRSVDADISESKKEVLSFVQVSKTLIRDNRLAPVAGH